MLFVPLGMAIRRSSLVVVACYHLGRLSPMSPGQELFGSFTPLHNITTFSSKLPLAHTYNGPTLFPKSKQYPIFFYKEL